MTTKPLTPREARFVAAYRLHGQGKRAALEAGYSPDSAKSLGWKLLRKPKIIAALRDGGIAIELTPHNTGEFGKNGRTYKRNGMTLLQERFVAEYLIDGNATQAAIRAGLPGKKPDLAGSRMLHLRGVAAAIAQERAAREARLRVTADRIIGELARIAFADIGAVADWGPEGVVLKEKAALSPHDRAAVAELSSEKAGAQKTQVRMHSKQRALDALARHLGLYGPGIRPAVKPAETDRKYRDELVARLRRIAKGEAAPADSGTRDAASADRAAPDSASPHRHPRESGGPEQHHGASPGFLLARE